MPTASRLVAAVIFAGLAYYVSTIVQGYFVDERPLPNLPYINAGFGIIVGWKLAGAKAGFGFNSMLGYWLTTTISLLLVCLFFNSAAEMVRRSMRRQYDGPSDAVIGVFELMLELGQRVLTVEVLAVSFVGGLIASMLIEVVGRTYR